MGFLSQYTRDKIDPVRRMTTQPRRDAARVVGRIVRCRRSPRSDTIPSAWPSAAGGRTGHRQPSSTASRRPPASTAAHARRPTQSPSVALTVLGDPLEAAPDGSEAPGCGGGASAACCRRLPPAAGPPALVPQPNCSGHDPIARRRSGGQPSATSAWHCVRLSSVGAGRSTRILAGTNATTPERTAGASTCGATTRATR